MVLLGHLRFAKRTQPHVPEGDGVTDAPEVEEIPGVAPDSAPTLDVESDATEEKE